MEILRIYFFLLDFKTISRVNEDSCKFPTIDNIPFQNFYVSVAIRSRVFMPEANKMANFMHDGSISYAIFSQIYALAKAVTHSTNI